MVWVLLCTFFLSPATVGNSSGATATYTVDASALGVDSHGNLFGTIKVSNSDGTPVAAVPVSVLYWTYGGSGARAFEVIVGVTSTSGVITASKKINPTPRKVVLAAKVGSSESADTVPFTIMGPDGGELPTTFLTGPALNDNGSVHLMDFSDAKTYCSNHGGRLPRVQGSDVLYSWGELDPNKYPKFKVGASVDGFGPLDSPRPGVPFLTCDDFGCPRFWTGTVHGENPDWAWRVFQRHGATVVRTDVVWTFAKLRVACVP